MKPGKEQCHVSPGPHFTVMSKDEPGRIDIEASCSHRNEDETSDALAVRYRRMVLRRRVFNSFVLLLVGIFLLSPGSVLLVR